MSITLYGLNKCDTCKKARAWFAAQNLDCVFIDYREQPIDMATLRRWAADVGWAKVVNRASMTWRKLDEAQKNPQSDDDWLALVQAHETLIRRPVIVTDKGVQFGFKENKVSEII